MKTKRGISLVILVITILVMIILTSITIVGIGNTLIEVNKDEFVVELATIKEKVKEHYLTIGVLPVKAGQEYTVNELLEQYTDDTYKVALEKEIRTNKDSTNTFCTVDLEKLNITTSERGLEKDDLDVFAVTTNTLNIYYLKGVQIDEVAYFSEAMLVSNNQIDIVPGENATDVDLSEELSVSKNTNVWTNEVVIEINNKLEQSETLQYSIAGCAVKSVASNNSITINASNMTNEEIAAFASNKMVTIAKLNNGVTVSTNQISISNLDITAPNLSAIEMLDTSNEKYNVVKINMIDSGGSGIKALYYDIDTVLKDNVQVAYYTNRTDVKNKDLISFGKISNDGVVRLEKNIKSIIATAVDNAGNISDVVTYTIEDTYLISK